MRATLRPFTAIPGGDGKEVEMVVQMECPWCDTAVALDAAAPEAAVRCEECAVLVELADEDAIALPQAA